jgi:hypothetical protein
VRGGKREKGRGKREEGRGKSFNGFYLWDSRKVTVYYTTIF